MRKILCIVDVFVLLAIVFSAYPSDIYMSSKEGFL